MMTNDERNVTIQEDNSEAWWHQLDLEDRQVQERALTPQVREVIELLDRSVAMLKNIPDEEYPAVADLRHKLAFERKFLQTKFDIRLNELVKTARNLLIK
jgi:hypothetical protein